MPPSIPPIFFCVSSSTFLTASLQAAITRSCSISTSPATSGSIFTPVTFLWPSIFDGHHAAAGGSFHADQRDLLLHLLLHLLRLLHHGLHVSGHFHSQSLLQISDGTHLAVREHFLEALDFGIGKRPRGDFVFSEPRAAAQRALKRRLRS